MSNDALRPLTDAERPHLEAMGARLRELREQQGVSARWLAANARCNVSTVSRLERGLRRPRRSMLLRLVATLGLLGGVAGTDTPRAWAQELLKLAGPTLAPESAFPKARRR